MIGRSKAAAAALLDGAAGPYHPDMHADTVFATDVADRLRHVLREGRAPRLHGLVVLRHGRQVLEHYGAGDDFKWSDPLGSVTFRRDTLHDIRSVTKSITGLLYGIALAGGKVPEPGDGLLRHFPSTPHLPADPRRARLRVEHALSMTLGIEWKEDVPYTSPANSEIAMELAPDRYRYILERPVVDEPGRRWSYSGGASALIGHLIERGTGKTLPEFARDALFRPLGIEAFEWIAGADGVASSASGLRLAPHDLASIGQMVLDGGDRGP